MHPLKLVQIKNPFGILSTNPQIPWEWVGPIFFKKKMFGWDTLMYMLSSIAEITSPSPNPQFGHLVKLCEEIDQKYSECQKI